MRVCALLSEAGQALIFIYTDVMCVHIFFLLLIFNDSKGKIIAFYLYIHVFTYFDGEYV